MSSLEAHYELMALAEGHRFANSWMILDEEATAQQSGDQANNERFVSDGL
jgi:hypothetical protein